MESLEEMEVTVQGIGSPVPASGRSEQAGSTTSSSCDRSASGVEHLAPVASNVTSERRLKAFDRLGQKIDELYNYIRGKNNVHGEIRRLVSSIRSTYDMATKDGTRSTPVQPVVSTEVKTSTTQTSPVFVQSKHPSNKVSAHVRGEVTPKNLINTNPLNSKRKKDSPPSTMAIVTKRRVLNSHVSSPLEEQVTQDTESEFQKVHSYKRRKKRKRPVTRPDALIIRKKGECSYAEILSKVKQDPDLKDLGNKVNKIRRTATGELLIVFDGSNTEQTDQFKSSIKGKLGDDADVETRVHKMDILIKDLDESVTKEEVIQALNRQIDGAKALSVDAVIAMRKAFGDTQTAVVRLPAEIAARAIDVAKIRIGWVVCRIREKIRPVKCAKCWLYGHLKRNCRSDVDRSDLCIKCGGKGHKADKCTGEANCLLCLEKGDEANIRHVAGSGRCPLYVRALQALKDRK